MTDNVARRLTQHNSRKSKWTKSRGPWRVVWTSGPLSPSEARKLEAKLKRQKGGDGLYKITGLARVAVNPAAAGLKVRILPLEPHRDSELFWTDAAFNGLSVSSS